MRSSSLTAEAERLAIFAANPIPYETRRYQLIKTMALARLLRWDEFNKESIFVRGVCYSDCGSS